MTGWKASALVVVLAVSLLGNALALGAGLRLYHMRQAMLGDGAAITLPRAVRRDLMAALVSHADQLRPALQAVQTARQSAVLAVTAAPYDPAKAAAALDTLRGALGELMRQGQTVVLEDLGKGVGG